MKYNVFLKKDYLQLVEKNLSEEDLIKYGQIIDKIYDDYEKEDAEFVGFILENKYYAFKERIK